MERVAARAVLSGLSLSELRQAPVIPYEEDELTRLVEDSLDEEAFRCIAHLSLAEFREWLLETQTDGDSIRSISPGLTPEMVAGVCKLMSNMDLMLVGAKCRVVVRANGTLGLPNSFSSRLQPNHPRDDIEGILHSVREGLAYGCGDAVIGVNPATDSAESTAQILRALHGLMQRNDIPTQHCVLSHVTVQMKALELGCPMDLMFQSLSGSEAGNSAFGISISMLDEALEMMAIRPTRILEDCCGLLT